MSNFMNNNNMPDMRSCPDMVRSLKIPIVGTMILILISALILVGAVVTQHIETKCQWKVGSSVLTTLNSVGILALLLASLGSIWTFVVNNRTTKTCST